MKLNRENTSDVLRRARDLISDPESWTKGTMARDNKGRYDHASSTTAAQWCAAGAILCAAEWSPLHCDNDATSQRALGAMHRQVAQDTSRTLSQWNDAPERTHEEVLAAFDAAVELERWKETQRQLSEDAYYRSLKGPNDAGL